MRRLLLLAPTAFLLAGCPSPGAPAPDSCDGASASGVTELLIGVGFDDQPFKPYHDGDIAELRQGGQGLTMLPVRLFVAGPSAPSCLSQDTIVDTEDGGSFHDGLPRKTYPEAGGRATKSIYIIIDGSPFGGDGRMMTVSSTVGSSTAMVRLGPAAPDLGVPFDLAPSD